MAKELTAITLAKIKPGSTRQEIPDGRVAGLYFIVQPSGKRSWAVRYRFGGKPRKLTLGAYPAIDLKRARELAGAAKNKVEEGNDPGAEKKATKAAAAIPANDLVEVVVAQFISHYARRHLKAGTAREVARVLDREIAEPWRGRRLSEIRRRDINALLDDIVTRGSPISANRTLAWLRRLCSWAVERGLIETNPCAGIGAPAPETARDRVLSDDELATVWKAACGLELPYAAFVKLLILTGARRMEVAEMRWREIDFDGKLWTLPRARSKGSREHTVPLSDAAVEMLKTLPRIGDDFVFTLNDRNCISGFHLIKQRIDALLPPDTPPWTFHDLRRTFASGCARLGIAVHVVEKCLNHSSGTFRGIVSVYQRHDYANEKRQALAAWARHVAGLTDGSPKNVLNFAPR